MGQKPRLVQETCQAISHAQRAGQPGVRTRSSTPRAACREPSDPSVLSKTSII